MRLLSILLLICIGCVGVKPPVAPIRSEPIIPPAPMSTMHPPIREIDLLHQRMQDHTVSLIKIKKDDKGHETSEAYCTGVWVGTDEILTAAHCVIEGNRPWKTPVGNSILYGVKDDVQPNGGTYSHPGKIIDFNENNDLVLIQVDLDKMPAHGVVKLADELPAIGERVYQVGHPDKLYWTFSSGEVSAYRYTTKVGDIIQVNIAIYFGNSGGGLFDRDGKLIGICSQKLEMSSMGYYIRLDNIKKFLDEAHLKRAL